MDDNKYLQISIDQSKASLMADKFPAGALLVKEDKIISESISDSYPGYQHAESQAVDIAFQKYGKLSDVTLYASMEPCLMCLTRAYWSGIRRIVYAIPRDKINQQYYEGMQNNSEIVRSFNYPIEYIHISDLEMKALEVVRKWEEK